MNKSISKDLNINERLVELQDAYENKELEKAERIWHPSY